MAIVPSVASGGRSQIPCDLKLALKQQGAEVEEAPSFGAASGQVVVVAGLARGSGAAASLMNELQLPPCADPESLVIRGRTIALTARRP